MLRVLSHFRRQTITRSPGSSFSRLPVPAFPRTLSSLPSFGPLAALSGALPVTSSPGATGFLSRMDPAPKPRPSVDPQPSTDADSSFYRFGHLLLPEYQVFAVSEKKLSFATVNLKPVLPGHVLVISTRVAAKVKDLTVEELTDLWSTAQRVGKMLEAKYHTSSLTFAIQDGPASGQTISHVHIHIIPRHFGDFQRNDQIYDELEKDAVSSSSTSASASASSAASSPTVKHMDLDYSRPPRKREEMADEAVEYRALMKAIQ